MFRDQRRHSIHTLLLENGSARVKDLSRAFGVTETTIRKDLLHLEEEGHIVREHGGAYIRDYSGAVRTLSITVTGNLSLKKAIARKAATFVQEGDTLIIDSGSTSTEFCRCLLNHRNLTVLTNGLNIALILGAEPTNEVTLSGGTFKAPTLSLTGDSAAVLFSRTHVDKLFLAVRGFSIEHGLTYASLSDLPVKKAMLDTADTVYLLADSSKIGTTSFASLDELDQVDVLITDPGAGTDQIRQLEDYGIRVVVAD